MKKYKIDLLVLLLIVLCSTTAVFGQQESDKKSEKEVFITTTVDENGKTITKKIVKTNGKEEVFIIHEDEGEDVNVFIEKNKGEGESQTVTVTTTVDEDGNVTTRKVVKSGGKEKVFVTKNTTKDIDIDVNKDGKVRSRVKIIVDDEGGEEMEVIQWDGEGDMPEALRKRLDEKGIQMEMVGDHNVFHIDTDDAPNNACLGVMIGEKKTVENIDGEETTTTEGTSDLGVPILDIIESSGAEAAGLLKDDIITQINGLAVSNIQDVLNVLAPFDAGTSVSINYLRDGQAAQVNATLKACGDTNSIEIEEEHEWTDENGNTQNLNGTNWVFIGEEGEVASGKKLRKVIVKKNKDGINEIIEIDEVDGGAPVLESGKRSLALETIDFFPNPTDGIFTLKFKALKAPTVVKVVDLVGKEVYREVLPDFDGNYNKEIDLGNAPKGILVFSIHQGDKVYSEKIILQK